MKVCLQYTNRNKTHVISSYIYFVVILYGSNSVSNGHTIDSDEINLDNVEFETSMAKWELNLDMWTMCIYLFKKNGYGRNLKLDIKHQFMVFMDIFFF